MLPAHKPTARTETKTDALIVHPGTWWRLTSTQGNLAQKPAPDHGLVLMVCETRLVDGDLHTVILYPHPTWGGGKAARIRMLAEEFLTSFAPEPQGETLREIEITELMGKVASITADIANPPATAVLLERQKDKETKSEKPETAGENTAENTVPAHAHLDSGSTVPAALLPSEDIIAAQSAIETRIAGFEARRQWITERTEELTGTMNLVATYQAEKVDSALASISQETRRAEDLLKSVQTMRLFLGEDMHVTELLAGESADPSEPLTFMQRMLFLDEEIYINDLLTGFDHATMQDLPTILGKDFSLVERMLPYPRCVAITRIRRHKKELDFESRMNIAELLQAIEIARADMRIHILVRDGTRVHLITADEATSNAERLFPSREEIENLFTRGHYKDQRTITPHDIDYTDARSRHDNRALFYKRFLLILWGVHERTDVFGPFAPKGINWLDATVHSEHFRFIHDEENVLTDGRPGISDFIKAQNAKIRPGSRIMIKTDVAINPDSAPHVYHDDRIQTYMKGELIHAFEISEVSGDHAEMKARAGYYKSSRYSGKDRKEINCNFTVAKLPKPSQAAASTLFEQRITEGVLCLDHLTLEEMDYYINSRAARLEYREFLHLFNRARAHVLAEKMIADQLLAELLPASGTAEANAFAQCLKLWRSANKWRWPETASTRKAVLKLMDRMKDAQKIALLHQEHARVALVSMMHNGDIRIVHDAMPHQLPDGTPLPFMTEEIHKGAGLKASGTSRIISWFAIEHPCEIVFYRDESIIKQVRDRLAPERDVTLWQNKVSRQRIWQFPQGFADGATVATLDAISNRDEAMGRIAAILSGTDPEASRMLLHLCFENARSNARERTIALPELDISLGLVYGEQDDGMKRAWMIDLCFNPREFAWKNGLRDEVMHYLKEIYAYPDKVAEKLDSRHGTGIFLSAREITMQRSIRDLFKPDVCLSFDEDRRGIWKEDTIENQDPTWQEVLAQLLTKRTGKEFRKSYSIVNLQKTASRMQFIMPKEAEKVIENVLSR